MRSILMETYDNDVKIVINLTEKNKHLCDELWDILPFNCIMEHGMVSGKTIYCWVPMISTSEVEYSMLHNRSPIGTVNYSQNTGNKITIKYGSLNEDLSAPIIGFVSKESIDDLKEFGNLIWQNYYLNKVPYKVKFRALENNYE